MSFVVGYEKRDHFAHYVKFRFNLESTVATDLNLGMTILSSSCYTRKEVRALPIFGMGGACARINHIRKSPFYVGLQLGT